MLLKQAEKIQWKQRILAACIAELESRVQVAQTAMHTAQAAANAEDKSSAGDKYETGRAMSQLDREMNARQLEEAFQELNQANTINTNQIYDRVGKGSVAVCEAATFFVGIGLGMREIEGRQLALLSLSAPLTVELLNKKAGDFFQFKGKKTKLTAVF